MPTIKSSDSKFWFLQDRININRFRHRRLNDQPLYPEDPVNYQTIQSNGQRIFALPSNTITPIPPKGSEIFIGNLPRDLYEKELFFHFVKIGPIYKLRLMMDFSGSTRGFAFITYYSPEKANKAIKIYNNWAIREDAIITVHLSLDNRRLFFGNIPRNQTADEIKTHLVKFMEGITDIILYQEPQAPALNRGFVFVEFDSHAQAAIARRQMLAGIIRLWDGNKKIFVDWAEPEPIVNSEVLNQVTILYIKNIPVDCPLNILKIHILNRLDGIEIMRLYKKDNYAFVHFFTREMAEIALERLENHPITLSGRNLIIEWARPIKYSKKNRNVGHVEHFCLSVPPKLRRIVEKSKKKNCGSRKNSSGDGESDAASSNSWESLEREFENMRLN